MKKLIATLFAALISGAAFADFDNSTLRDYGVDPSAPSAGFSTMSHGDSSGTYQNFDVQ